VVVAESKLRMLQAPKLYFFDSLSIA